MYMCIDTGPGTTTSSQSFQTSKLEEYSWADELGGKISLFYKPTKHFFDNFIPRAYQFVGIRLWPDPTEVFAARVPNMTKKTEKMCI